MSLYYRLLGITLEKCVFSIDTISLLRLFLIHKSELSDVCQLSVCVFLETFEWCCVSAGTCCSPAWLGVFSGWSVQDSGQVMGQDCGSAAIHSNLEKVCPVDKFDSNQLSVCNRKCVCHICSFETWVSLLLSCFVASQVCGCVCIPL